MVPFIALLYLTGAPGFWLALMFLVASVTDLLDGFLARQLNQVSKFGAFLDPVADKVMVAVVLILLVSDATVLNNSLSSSLFSVVIAVILSREIAVSGLREWMSGIGNRTQVAVNRMGKIKTSLQMSAITLLLYGENIGELPVFRIGEIMLYLAALLTLWSMVRYLRAAWPELGDTEQK